MELALGKLDSDVVWHRGHDQLPQLGIERKDWTYAGCNENVYRRHDRSECDYGDGPRAG